MRHPSILVEYQYRGGLRHEFDVLNQATEAQAATAARKKLKTALAFGKELPTKIVTILSHGYPNKALDIRDLIPKRLWAKAGLE